MSTFSDDRASIERKLDTSRPETEEMRDRKGKGKALAASPAFDRLPREIIQE
jgi:hypothetical protein